MSADQGGPGRREVAWRLFAAEFDDADLEYSSSDEERAPNYVVTPTGARINRLFVVGVLTEVEAVSDEVLRGRIVDPTGAFVVYAGQYQPDALAFLESADVPQFVAVTGKARTFQPEDSEQVYTSIRPESINAVDAETRDRWTVQTAEHTLDRVTTFGTALDLTHSGDALREALVAGGVEEGLADGIALALEHYGTTEGYLAAVAGMALDAARVVAGERDEVPPLDVAPDDETGASLDAEYSLTELDVDVHEIPEPAELEADAAEAGADAAAAGETDGESESEPDSDELGDFEPEDAEASDGIEPESAAAADEAEPAEVEDAADAAEVQPTDEDGDPEVTPAEESVADEQFEPEPDEADLGTGDVGDEMYELDEEERREVEEEFGTEFSTGAELDEESDEAAGGAPAAEPEETEPEREADEPATEEPEAVEATESAAEEPETEAADGTTEAQEPEDTEPAEEPEETDEPSTETDAEEPAEEPEPEEAEAETGETEEPDDLEAVVVETMRDLDEGDGANRGELVAEVTSAYDVSEGDVEAAIQDALMSGQCYEADEETLKPI